MAYFKHHTRPEEQRRQQFLLPLETDDSWGDELNSEDAINFSGEDSLYGDVYPDDQALRSRKTARIVSRTFDFVLTLAGTLVCFFLVAVLVYLVNWVSLDLKHSFSLLSSGL